MLFSNPEVQEFLEKNFVLTWNEVRPVPKVEIDFGDGKKLTRTLMGNTVIYVCRPDGTVVDALPGIYTPHDFLKEIKVSLAALAVSDENLADHHKALIEADITKERARVSMSKARVESPLLAALGIPQYESPDGESKPMALDISKIPKSRTEMEAMGSAEQVVAKDSSNNVRYVRPIAHFILSRQNAPQKPEQLRETIFAQALGFDIKDPYLGLASLLLPGTPGGRTN